MGKSGLERSETTKHPPQKEIETAYRVLMSLLIQIKGLTTKEGTWLSERPVADL